MRTASSDRYTRPLVWIAVAIVAMIVLLYIGSFISGASSTDAITLTGFGWLPYVLVGAAIIYGLYVAFADKPIWQVGTREVVMMAVGAALYGMLSWATNYLQIPSVSQVALRPAVVIPVLFGVLFGPVVGFFAGFVGNILGDALTGWGVFPIWDIGNGLMGMVAGLAAAFPRSRRSFNGLTIAIGAVGVLVSLWVLLSPATEIPWSNGQQVGALWWVPLLGVALVIGLRYILRDRPEIAVALLWSALGVIVGIGFASIADIWWNGFSPAVAILGEFVPAAGSNLVNIAILLPLLYGAYVSARARSGRA
jgi:uncharacterized membrane protein